MTGDAPVSFRSVSVASQLGGEGLAGWGVRRMLVERGEGAGREIWEKENKSTGWASGQRRRKVKHTAGF